MEAKPGDSGETPLTEQTSGQPMTPHLEDDELVLHYYGEMTDAQEAEASTHLGHCASCHASYRRLKQVLAAVDEAALAGADVPDGFERTVWARLEPELQRTHKGLFSWLVFSPARLAWAAVIVALVTGAFFAGRLMPRSPAAGGATQASAEQIRERILLIDLGDHLDRSQMVLVELVNAEGTGQVNISGERARAEQLVSSNRLYRQTAAETGDANVVALLDELERVLVDVAASPETVTSQDLDDVRRRIESKGLLFKVRVVSSEVRERQKSIAQAGAGQRSSL
jgi:hypothetical protein